MYDRKAEALAWHNRLKAKAMFIETAQGIDFAFERKPCGQSWGCGKATFIGASAWDQLHSRRVGLCKHQIPLFDIVAWRADRYTVQHVEWIWEHARAKVRKAMLHNEMMPRKGDGIYEEWSRGEMTHTLRIANLTRPQAIQIYKMADAIIGEGL